MRRLSFVVLIAASTACGAGRATAPDTAILDVRLRDDAGKSAGRNRVVVALASGTQIDASTDADGNVAIAVPEAGTYDVRVIPREGYAVSSRVVKRVTVAERGTVVVDFTLYRGTRPTDEFIEVVTGGR